MRSLHSSLAARLLAEATGRGPWWRPCQSERPTATRYPLQIT